MTDTATEDVTAEEIAWWWTSRTVEQAQAFLASATSDDLARLEQALAEVRSMGWRTDPATMAHHLTRGEYQLRRYITYLSGKFRDAVEGRSKRQIWNIATRYGKSDLASGWGPVWTFDRHPDASFILVSYGAELAIENAVNVRDRLLAYADQLRCQLRPDRGRQGRWVTTEGGGLLAAGFDTRITGFGVSRHGGIVIDDPYKNWQEAHSQTRRQHVQDHYRSVVRNRLDDEETGWIIAVHARWHLKDFTAFLQDESGEAWEVVSLPTFARDGDPLGRAPGEVLDESVFNTEQAHVRARAVGAYLAAAMEQQDPQPETGGELQRAWWRWYEAGAAPTAFHRSCVSWDMKMKEKRSGDYVVGQVWGRHGADFYGLEQVRGQWPIPTVKAAMALMAVRWPHVSTHVIENTGNGPEVMAELRRGADSYEVTDDVADELGMTPDERDAVDALLRRGMTGLVPANPDGDKVARARAHVGLLEAGNVWLPLGARWADEFVNEAAAFPPQGKDDHDDMVDAWSQAMRYLRGQITFNPGRRTQIAPTRAATIGPRPVITPRR